MRSTKAAAMAIITELRGWSGTSPWRSLDKGMVCGRLKHLINE